MRRFGSGGHFGARVGVFVAPLAAVAALSGPAVAEDAGFHCGRENHDRLAEPREVWFELYRARERLAHELRRNGNDDLAAKFERCAIIALHKAAELGHREAQYQFGVRLALRKPQTPAGMAESYEWLQKAAAQGHKQAKVLVDTWPWR
jgi:TPR repeat protein